MLAFVPAVVGIITGNALNLWAVIRYHQTSRWGIRLVILGAGLTPLVPGGLLVLSGFATGHLD